MLGLAKRSLVFAAALLLASCSSGPSGAVQADGGSNAATDEDALFVPRGLGVTALAGGCGVLDVVALTLRETAGGLALYAALRNTGDVPACSAALSVELFDAQDQSRAAGIVGLLSQRFYRLTDGSDAVAACVAPGDVTMAAVTDLPPELAIEDVRHVVYRCPYFALDVVPIDGLTVHALRSMTSNGRTSFAGTLVNGLDVTVRDPSVTVFPVNREGRPLGAVTETGTADIPPGGRWTFETDVVHEAGVDAFAYPAGALDLAERSTAAARR
jgi:hypothetical protein